MSPSQATVTGVEGRQQGPMMNGTASQLRRPLDLDDEVSSRPNRAEGMTSVLGGVNSSVGLEHGEGVGITSPDYFLSSAPSGGVSGRREEKINFFTGTTSGRSSSGTAAGE